MRPPKTPARKTPNRRTKSPSTAADEREIVLLCVTGLSPAIITETIWALARENPPVVPHRIVAITTSEGREKLLGLLQPSSVLRGIAPWDALRADLIEHGVPVTGRLHFGDTSENIRIITDFDETRHRTIALEDLTTRADNEAAADFILARVAEIAGNSETHLICSIAGGRKTMGALLYAAATLAARETDRVTHVLVDKPFEANHDFYFRGQPGGPLQDKEGNLIDVAAAGISLADIPFPALRNLFLKQLRKPVGGFRRLVELCREEVSVRTGLGLLLHFPSRTLRIEVNQAECRLGASEYLILRALAERICAGKSAPKDAKILGAEFLALGEKLCEEAQDDFAAMIDAVDPKRPERAVGSRLNSLRQKLGASRHHAVAQLALCLPPRNLELKLRADQISFA